MKRFVLLAALASALTATHADTTAQPDQPRRWDFTVLLDGEPIGMHRFSLQPEAQGALAVVSQAEFQVRLLGVPVYRYRHRAVERWQGGCLQSLEADTDDDGERSHVELGADAAGRLQLRTAQSTTEPSGCLSSFAYWNPALHRQARLLNAQTGRIEPVQWTRIEAGTLDVDGGVQPAVRWRLSGTERPLDVWWTDDGRWVGLDATVRGGRRLSYRLRP